MLFKLILLFVLLPWIELWLLLAIGERIGTLATLGLILFTGVLGATLARYEGAQAFARISRTLRQGGLPTDDVIEGALILAAGLVLLTPGFLTDATGFLLLIPPARRSIRNWLKTQFRQRTNIVFTTTARGDRPDNGRPRDSGNPDVIDIQAEPLDDERS